VFFAAALCICILVVILMGRMGQNGQDSCQGSSMTPRGGAQLLTAQTLNQRRSPTPPNGLPANAATRGEVQQADEICDLPAICPSLILPHTEARFMIQMDHLLSLTSGPVNILGTSGRKLLHSMVCDSPDGRRCLMLSSCGCEDDPRTCIFTSHHGSGAEALEVFGKAGKFYGSLQLPGGNQAVLTHSGAGGQLKPVLQIDMGNHSDLSMSASTMDGRLLASAGRNATAGGRSFEGGDSWRMQVKPGTDAVLITSCMLALILLRPWPTADGRYSMGAPSVPTAMSLRPHTAAM